MKVLSIDTKQLNLIHDDLPLHLFWLDLHPLFIDLVHLCLVSVTDSSPLHSCFLHLDGVIDLNLVNVDLEPVLLLSNEEVG